MTEAQTAIPRGPHWPLAALAAFVVALAAYALLRGQAVPWDLRNYHWYDAWAWWHGRPQDFAPAQLQSWFNPLLHVPFWWLATHVPARAAVFALALVQGANAFLAYAIARRLLPPRSDGLALACACVGAIGSTQLIELGATMGDNLVSIGLLGAFALLLPAIVDGVARPWRCAGAGLLCGAMVGLKLACAPVALGCFVASTFAARGMRGRALAGAAFAVAALAGLALVAGAWFLHLWRDYGNPLHPYFAAIFGSEWRPPFASGDARYHVGGFVDALVRPWSLVRDWRATSEVRFRDLRLVALLLAAIAWPIVRRRADPRTRPALDAMLAAFAAAWISWLFAFGYYRYLAAFELLAPAIVAATMVASAPMRRAWVASALVLLVVTTNPGEVPRVPFANAFLEQQASPLARGTPSLVLLVGDSPTAHVVPGLGAEHTYVRVSGNFAGSPLPRWRADEEIASRIDGNALPLLVLHQARDTAAIAPALARFGVAVDDAGCESVVTSWALADEPPIRLCRGARVGTDP